MGTAAVAPGVAPGDAPVTPVGWITGDVDGDDGSGANGPAHAAHPSAASASSAANAANLVTGILASHRTAAPSQRAHDGWSAGIPPAAHHSSRDRTRGPGPPQTAHAVVSAAHRRPGPGPV